ncbi:hypothetical protein BSKO_08504 [Bryopsis sp. KO-2023]|nr:hypothetical protein BSKO_08504 [Bryopsis sp. KO-2023]
MKTMDAVIEEELQRQEVKREDIEELNLDGQCRAKSIVGLDGCKALKTLSLCHVGLTTLDGFPSLPKLTELHLADNKISTGLGVLSGLASLEKLNLVHNTIVSVEELAPLAKLNIKWLDLFACPVESIDGFREKVFGIIPSLEVLDNADRTGKENTDSEDESYVESEEENGSEEEAEHSESGEEDGGEDDGDKEAGKDPEDVNDGDNGDESEAEKVDLSMLVEGPPVDDSDRDVDYNDDVDAPSSEDVDDEDNADLDNDDSETDRGIEEPSGVGPSNVGKKKRKREGDDEEQVL